MFKSWFLLVLAALCVGILALAFASADYSKIGRGVDRAYSGDKCIGVIRLEGEIVSGSSFSSGQVSSQEIIDAIDKARNDEQVSSLFVEINSPGGSAVASKEVFDALFDSSKPSVAYLGEIAASGGYYAASASDFIVANPNTITGSIGARTTVITYEDLFQKLGLRQENIKTGNLKDMGEGNRNLTEEERQILQALLNETLENFKADVVAGRGNALDPVLFNQALDARVLSAKQALAAGLVDDIGNRKLALDYAAKLGKIDVKKGERPNECELVEQRGLLDVLMSRLSASIADGLAARLSTSVSQKGVSFK